MGKGGCIMQGQYRQCGASLKPYGKITGIHSIILALCFVFLLAVPNLSLAKSALNKKPDNEPFYNHEEYKKTRHGIEIDDGKEKDLFKDRKWGTFNKAPISLEMRKTESVRKFDNDRYDMALFFSGDYTRNLVALYKSDLNLYFFYDAEILLYYHQDMDQSGSQNYYSLYYHMKLLNNIINTNSFTGKQEINKNIIGVLDRVDGGPGLSSARLYSQIDGFFVSKGRDGSEITGGDYTRCGVFASEFIYYYKNIKKESNKIRFYVVRYSKEPVIIPISQSALFESKCPNANLRELNFFPEQVNIFGTNINKIQDYVLKNRKYPENLDTTSPEFNEVAIDYGDTIYMSGSDFIANIVLKVLDEVHDNCKNLKLSEEIFLISQCWLDKNKIDTNPYNLDNNFSIYKQGNLLMKMLKLNQ
jgi:hypothetical protein